MYRSRFSCGSALGGVYVKGAEALPMPESSSALKLQKYESVLRRYVTLVTCSSGLLPNMFKFMSAGMFFTCITLVFFTLRMSPAFAPFAATSSFAFWIFPLCCQAGLMMITILIGIPFIIRIFSSDSRWTLSNDALKSMKFILIGV